MDVWIKFTQKKYRCQRIKEKMLLDFFQELGEKHEGDQDQSLGFRKDLYNEAEIKKNLLKMGIRNENGKHTSQNLSDFRLVKFIADKYLSDKYTFLDMLINLDTKKALN